MDRLLRCSVIALFTLILSACSIFSSDKDSVRAPKPLEDIKNEKIKLVEVWSKGIGASGGKSFESLMPAIDGDKIFVSGLAGNVFAFDRATGKEIWKKQLGVRVSGGVSAVNDTVFLGTLDGEVIALKQKTVMSYGEHESAAKY